jgi:hypothetical protein
MSTAQTTNADLDLDDDDDDNQDSNSVAALRSEVKRLNKENRRLAALEPENASLKTTIAIRDAGLDLNERQLKALLASHEGESTPDLLRKTAEELGFAEPIPDNDPDDEAAHRQLDAARKGSTTSANQPSYDDEINAAQSKDEVIAIARKHGRPVEGL